MLLFMLEREAGSELWGNEPSPVPVLQTQPDVLASQQLDE